MSGYGTMRVPCANGKYAVVDISAIIDDLAVSRAVAGPGWRISHVVTGFALPFLFSSAAVAEEAARALNEFIEWDGFLAAMERGERPNTIPMAISVCEAHGGTPHQLAPVTPDGIQERRASGEATVIATPDSQGQKP